MASTGSGSLVRAIPVSDGKELARSCTAQPGLASSAPS